MADKRQISANFITRFLSVNNINRFFVTQERHKMSESADKDESNLLLNLVAFS